MNYPGTAHLEKGKPTPPAPQNPTRRLKFYMAHPEFPRAKEWVERLNLQLFVHKLRTRSRVKVPVPVENKVEHAPVLDKPKPFFQHIISKIRKASQRGV